MTIILGEQTLQRKGNLPGLTAAKLLPDGDDRDREVEVVLGPARTRLLLNASWLLAWDWSYQPLVSDVDPH